MAKCCCCCDESTVKKGIWTAEEDHRLIAYVKKYGHWNWRRLPKFAGLSRCGKSCRLRWMNYLRPDIRRGNFTPREEETIIKLYTEIGGKWSKMAALMPGRTDNDIKNHWNTILKRRVMMKQQNMSMAMKPATEKTGSNHQAFAGEILSSNVNNGSTLIDQTGLTSDQLEITVNETPNAGNMDVPVDDQFKSCSPQLPAASSPASSAGDFWTDPLWLDSNFEMPFYDQLCEGFGEYNSFNVGLDEYLWQEGIY